MDSMKTLHRPVILSRPGQANNRLAELLSEKDDIEAWRWPAFTIELPEETELVTQRLANLDDVEMVLLPSPSSVAAVAHWVRKWPEHITLAAVGEGTAKAIRCAWGENVPILYPEGSAETSGSEALFALIEKRAVPSRVLILRGQTGREWLPQKLREMGSDVVVMCAYVRVPLELSARAVKQLKDALMGPSPILYVTSTDAVDAIMHAVRPIPGAQAWLARGTAVTIHPRVVRRLEESGFEHVEITSADDEAAREHILANLQVQTSDAV
ncbi:uroporphyrinogen-III synthase [Sutterella massiliensis]|uniref:Uroporphyrinogen-III synthase n=2 Tax=Sutterella massiliensis TaxID=1816689 RepID=A0ABS2DS47_9BURK|nr:uroporphyrinogen-III synthase [Sutterella massiliensis]